MALRCKECPPEMWRGMDPVDVMVTGGTSPTSVRTVVTSLRKEKK